MSKSYPNSRHYLTYRHSLRMVAVVTIGFVKDAKHHIDIQGFNVYHKNRLIKPFWRVWNAAGSDGRGVIGVLEANFVEPTHDKLGFERTIVLSRLEAREITPSNNDKSHKADFALRQHSKDSASPCKETTPSDKDKSYKVGYFLRRHSKETVSPYRETTPSDNDKCISCLNSTGHVYSDGGSKAKSAKKIGRTSYAKITSEEETRLAYHVTPVRSDCNASPACEEGKQDCAPNGGTDHIVAHSFCKGADISGYGHASDNSNVESLVKLKEENRELRERLEKNDELIVVDLLHDLRNARDKNELLDAKVLENLKPLNVAQR